MDRHSIARGTRTWVASIAFGYALAACNALVTDIPTPSATPAKVPPHARSNEADRQQLALATQQGEAYGAAVAWEREGAIWSAETRAGEYRLIAAISPSEGAWLWRSDHLEWLEPPQEMIHLRVFAADGADGRFVPGATLHARLLSANGSPLASAELPYGIYPLTDAYGANISRPDGVATLEVEVDPLPWHRHDPYNGERFYRKVVAFFRLDSLPEQPPGEPASRRAENAPDELKRAQNAALEQTIRAMQKQANDGGSQRARDYDVVYAVEYAEAYWQPSGTALRYTIENEQSTKYNAHVEAAPRDAFTGRFLPGLRVEATVEREDGAPISTHDVPLMWHSWLYHYGENWRVPGSGDYKLRLRFDPPSAPRYGKESGRRMTEAADLTFDHVSFIAGVK
jgi:hypothetical protein